MVASRLVSALLEMARRELEGLVSQVDFPIFATALVRGDFNQGYDQNRQAPMLMRGFANIETLSRI